jgi:transcriptional antiterminator NusG
MEDRQEPKKSEKKVEPDKGRDRAQAKGALRDSNKVRWYIIHAQSGHEKRVVAALRQRIESFGMQDLIQEILIPTREKVVIADGKKKTVRERLFPGYVAVRMVLTNDTWAVVRNTSGVTGFVGAGAKPTPLSQSEADAILQFTKMGAPKMEVSFKEGETVKIIDGPFADFLGKVEELDEDKGKVQVLVSIFGRETPVELDFLQVSQL